MKMMADGVTRPYDSMFSTAALRKIEGDLEERVVSPIMDGCHGHVEEARRLHELARWRALAREAIQQLRCGANDGLLERVSGGRILLKRQEHDLRVGVVNDLLAAAFAYDAFDDDRLLLQRHPVCNAYNFRKLLYCDCNAHIPMFDTGHPSPVAGWKFALRRLGLMHRLNHGVVKAVLHALTASPALNLGIILFHSDIGDAGWAEVMKQIGTAPEIIRRLVIEVESKGPHHPDPTRRAVEKLKAFGCRIAVSDLAILLRTKAGIEAGCPEILKMDHAALRCGRPEDRENLRCLIQTASDHAVRIVATGVQSERDLHAARRAGVRWIQGGLTDRCVRAVARH